MILTGKDAIVEIAVVNRIQSRKTSQVFVHP